MAQDEHSYVRGRAAYALGEVFEQVPDKAQACQDLHRLTQDEDSGVRLSAAVALGKTFGRVLDEARLRAIALADPASWLQYVGQASRIAIRGESEVIFGIRGIVGIGKSRLLFGMSGIGKSRLSFGMGKSGVFLVSPLSNKEKDQVWQDLIRLTKDPDKIVRMYSYHSLGRASIYKATISIDDEVFRENLKEAIDYFGKSAQEATYYNPARFCIPFYRSFLAVTSQEEGSQEQVDLYLAEAKNAIVGSKSRELLFKAVENLSQALREAQKASELHEAQAVLVACLPYCNQAEELLDETKDMAPGASGVIRRGLPIINRQIKTILKEIEENSSRLLEATKQTPFEPITARTAERIKDLSEIGYGPDAESIMDDVVPDIRVMCSFLPERSKESLCELKNWDSLGFEKKVSLFKRAITHCANEMENLSRRIGDKDDQIIYLRAEVLARLDNINFHVFKISIRSADVAQSLRGLEYELQKIKKIKDDLDRLGQSMDDLGIHQQQALQELQESAPKIIIELEEIVKKDDLDDSDKQEAPGSIRKEILNRLQALMDSPAGAALNLAADLSSIIGLILTIHPLR